MMEEMRDIFEQGEIPFQGDVQIKKQIY